VPEIFGECGGQHFPIARVMRRGKRLWWVTDDD
jgi:hypothetical protein